MSEVKDHIYDNIDNDEDRNRAIKGDPDFTNANAKSL